MEQYIVDAFTDKVFCGNQAAVCVLKNWIPDELMQNIARENNFSETAFTVKEGEKYHLRWFTPAAEIDFCGHATLGTAFVLLNFYEKSSPAVTAQSDSAEYDCVSRGFCPELGLMEDPVTGSSHCMIAPYWCDRLKKEKLTCFQASQRSGILYAERKNDRIIISGKAVLFSKSEILKIN
ncbi:MAG: PhzF family phenazine biosynthesis protein [Treponema sp.]|nr:PhzF family phenazine biosynthesis protein [Treponema sp.]